MRRLAAWSYFWLLAGLIGCSDVSGVDGRRVVHSRTLSPHPNPDLRESSSKGHWGCSTPPCLEVDGFTAPELEPRPGKHTPGAACEHQSDCQQCAELSHCGWCGSESACVDVDTSTCKHEADHTKCPKPQRTPQHITAELRDDIDKTKVVAEADVVPAAPQLPSAPHQSQHRHRHHQQSVPKPPSTGVSTVVSTPKAAPRTPVKQPATMPPPPPRVNRVNKPQVPVTEELNLLRRERAQWLADRAELRKRDQARQQNAVREREEEHQVRADIAQSHSSQLLAQTGAGVGREEEELDENPNGRPTGGGSVRATLRMLGSRIRNLQSRLGIEKAARRLKAKNETLRDVPRQAKAVASAIDKAVDATREAVTSLPVSRQTPDAVKAELLDKLADLRQDRASPLENELAGASGGNSADQEGINLEAMAARASAHDQLLKAVASLPRNVQGPPGTPIRPQRSREVAGMKVPAVNVPLVRDVLKAAHRLEKEQQLHIQHGSRHLKPHPASFPEPTKKPQPDVVAGGVNPQEADSIQFGAAPSPLRSVAITDPLAAAHRSCAPVQDRDTRQACIRKWLRVHEAHGTGRTTMQEVVKTLESSDAGLRSPDGALSTSERLARADRTIAAASAAVRDQIDRSAQVATHNKRTVESMVAAAEKALQLVTHQVGTNLQETRSQRVSVDSQMAHLDRLEERLRSIEDKLAGPVPESTNSRLTTSSGASAASAAKKDAKALKTVEAVGSGSGAQSHAGAAKKKRVAEDDKIRTDKEKLNDRLSEEPFRSIRDAVDQVSTFFKKVQTREEGTNERLSQAVQTQKQRLRKLSNGERA